LGFGGRLLRRLFRHRSIPISFPLPGKASGEV
jgi:hypothetical protein